METSRCKKVPVESKQKPGVKAFLELDGRKGRATNFPDCDGSWGSRGWAGCVAEVARGYAQLVIGLVCRMKGRKGLVQQTQTSGDASTWKCCLLLPLQVWALRFDFPAQHAMGKLRLMSWWENSLLLITDWGGRAGQRLPNLLFMQGPG